MAPPRPRRVRAKLTLVERQDGTVDVVIMTSPPLEATVAAGGVRSPAEFLRDPVSFELMVSALPGQRWRYDMCG